MGGGTLASIFKQVDRSVVKPVGQVVTKTGGFAVPAAFMAAAYAGGAMAADAAGADVLGAEAGTAGAGGASSSSIGTTTGYYGATEQATPGFFGTGATAEATPGVFGTGAPVYEAVPELTPGFGTSGAGTAYSTDAGLALGNSATTAGSAAKGLMTLDNLQKAALAVNTATGLLGAAAKSGTPAGGTGVNYTPTAPTGDDTTPIPPVQDLTGTAQTIGFENAKRKLLAARKTPSALVTGGLGDTSAAPVQKKTLLGE